MYDAETGWYYLQSRYYDPSIGRFISADVLLSTGPGVLGHNSFAYCLGNPVNMADDTGKIGLFVALLVGAAAGAVINVIANGIANSIDDNQETRFFDNAGWAALEGLFSGALSATPAGIGIQVIGNVLISGSCNSLQQLVEKDSDDFDFVELGVSMGSAAMSAFIGGSGAFNPYRTYYEYSGTGWMKVTYQSAASIVRSSASRQLARGLIRAGLTNVVLKFGAAKLKPHLVGEK